MKLYDRFFYFPRFRCDHFGRTKVWVEIADPNECYQTYTIEHHDEEGQGSLCEDLISEVRFK